MSEEIKQAVIERLTQAVKAGVCEDCLDDFVADVDYLLQLLRGEK